MAPSAPVKLYRFGDAMLKSKGLSLKWLLGSAVMISLVALSEAEDKPLGEITVLTIIDVVPNYAIARNVEDFSALLDKLVRDTQHAPGVLSFKVLQDPSRPNHFVIVSEWKDMHSFDVYSGADATKNFRQAVQSRLGGPFDERIYNALK
jgi:quinol monooxygenase YgiN